MQASTCRWRWVLEVLLAAVAAGVVLLGWTGRGPLGRPGREVIQDAVIHHFERASWFALNAQDYEALRPGLGREFREMAEWHIIGGPGSTSGWTQRTYPTGWKGVRGTIAWKVFSRSGP